MELSPHAIAAASFRIVKKGFDPDEVRAYLGQVANTVEQAQNQSTAMEARARAAVAKLQELSQQPAPEPEQQPARATDEVETISRTLLLAQRTADTAIAEARAEAEQVLSSARVEAAALLDEARANAAKAVDDARWEARRSAETERVKAEGEVQALLARREFLVSDVEHLEVFVQAQRERLREAALAISDLVDRVPAGLGEMRRPLLSAAGDVPLPLEGGASGVVESEPTPVAMQATPPAPEPDPTLPLERVGADEPPTDASEPPASDGAGAADEPQ